MTGKDSAISFLGRGYLTANGNDWSNIVPGEGRFDGERERSEQYRSREREICRSTGTIQAISFPYQVDFTINGNDSGNIVPVPGQIHDQREQSKQHRSPTRAISPSTGT
ncbi:MAG TPA: hypothetical protein DCR24_07785, partial [Bacillus bacterium]|nr:hypothetical protein [Bacillus sp. (in: firmicutes)]